MKKETIKKSRNLTPEERALSKRLYPEARKKFYTRLMAGEDFATNVKPWAENEIKLRDNEIDIYAKVLEALTVCENSKLPTLDVLEQALQISLEATKEIYRRQLDLIIPLFYVRKTREYETEFKRISYRFIDEMATKVGIFNGNTLTYLFLGDYFSVATGVLLSKHSKTLYPISSVCRMHLNTMLMKLAQKQGIISENAEDIAVQLFEKSLLRPLHKEEISLMVIYSLMQIYSWEMIDSHKKPSVYSENTKGIKEAIAFCEKNGYTDISEWNKALTLTDNFELWDRQTALITMWLMHIRLNEYNNKIKIITYRFILRSFQYGYLSNEIIDFIFDGDLFSNASTVVLALSCNNLKENNLTPYIQEKLSQMMFYLMSKEQIKCSPEEIAGYLLNTSLNRNLHKEEIAILNLYVLSQAFK